LSHIVRAQARHGEQLGHAGRERKGLGGPLWSGVWRRGNHPPDQRGDRRSVRRRAHRLHRCRTCPSGRGRLSHLSCHQRWRVGWQQRRDGLPATTRRRCVGAVPWGCLGLGFTNKCMCACVGSFYRHLQLAVVWLKRGDVAGTRPPTLVQNRHAQPQAASRRPPRRRRPRTSSASSPRRPRLRFPKW